MRILYHGTTRVDPEVEAATGAAFTTLDDLLASSDFVTLHVSLNEGTRHLIDAAALARMKPTAILVNTARGPVVDTGALTDALRTGTIWAAALDVTDPEPLPADHPLLGMDNCLVVPHIASASRAARGRMASMAAGARLQKLGDYRIPRLEQVFHRYGPAIRYVVEVKTSRDTQLAWMARRVSVIARQYGVTARCLVASFDAEFLKRLRELDREIATSILFDRPMALPQPDRPTPLFPPVDGIGPARELVNESLMGAARVAGLSVHPWTVDEPAEMRRLLDLGVASLTTNAPDVALTVRDLPTEEKGLALPETVPPPPA
jgi:glycerophosphoryl diester phosphodiesterase